MLLVSRHPRTALVMIMKFGAWRISVQGRQLLVAASVLVVAAVIVSNVFILLKLRESTLDDVANNLARRSLALAAQANLSLQSLSLVLDSVSEYVAPERLIDQDQFKSR